MMSGTATNMKVSELIDDSTNTCNMHILNTLFSEDDVEYILTIPVSSVGEMIDWFGILLIQVNTK